MMTAGRFHRSNLSMVDPLLQGGIADAQNICGFAWRQKLLHDQSPANQQNTALIAASSIRFYTIRIAVLRHSSRPQERVKSSKYLSRLICAVRNTFLMMKTGSGSYRGTTAG